MNEKERQGYKATLLELRKRLVRKVDDTEEALREDVVAPGEITNLPTHPADNAVEGLDAEIAIAQNEELLLEQVDAALDRLAGGTFGTCVDCGVPIAAERLEAIPYTPRCIRCASKHRGDAGGEPPVRGEPRRFR